MAKKKKQNKTHKGTKKTSQPNTKKAADESIEERPKVKLDYAPDANLKNILAQIKNKEDVNTSHMKSALNSPNMAKLLSDSGFGKDEENNFVKVQGRIFECIDEEQILLFFNSIAPTSWKYADIFKTELDKKSFKKLLPYLTLYQMPRDLDTKDKAHLYVKNGVLKITENSVELIPYSDFEHYINKAKIIQHDWVQLSESDLEDDITYRFLKHLAIVHDNEYNLDIVLSTIGFLVSRYRSKANPAMPIFNDAHIDGVSRGGNGKSMLIDMLKCLNINIVSIDGKTHKFDNEFSLCMVEKKAEIIVIDDIGNEKVIEDLYSMITGDMPIKKKYSNTGIQLSYEHIKFFGTTNMSLPNYYNSTRRRNIQVGVSDYFSKHKPIDVFGKELFGHEFNQKDWHGFLNTMVVAVQTAIKSNIFTKNLPSYWQYPSLQSIPWDARKIIDDKLDGLMCNGETFDIAEDLIVEFNSLAFGCNFTKLLHDYCHHRGYNIKQVNNNPNIWRRFEPKKHHSGKKRGLSKKSESVSACNSTSKKEDAMP